MKIKIDFEFDLTNYQLQLLLKISNSDNFIFNDFEGSRNLYNEYMELYRLECIKDTHIDEKTVLTVIGKKILKSLKNE